jgi:DNA-binding transcriptional ArsR family regulator
MAMPKSERTLDAIFKCLAVSARRAMLDRLTHGDATLGQLAAPLDMTLPAVHQHLGALERAKLVTCEKRGRERWCRLDTKTLATAERWIGERRSLWEGRLDALGEYLESTATNDKRRRKRS